MVGSTRQEWRGRSAARRSGPRPDRRSAAAAARSGAGPRRRDDRRPRPAAQAASLLGTYCTSMSTVYRSHDLLDLGVGRELRQVGVGHPLLQLRRAPWPSACRPGPARGRTMFSGNSSPRGILIPKFRSRRNTMSRKSIDSAPRSPCEGGVAGDVLLVHAQGVDQGGLDLLEDLIVRRHNILDKHGIAGPIPPRDAIVHGRRRSGRLANRRRNGRATSAASVGARSARRGDRSAAVGGAGRPAGRDYLADFRENLATSSDETARD